MRKPRSHGNNDLLLTESAVFYLEMTNENKTNLNGIKSDQLFLNFWRVLHKRNISVNPFSSENRIIKSLKLMTNSLMFK